MLSKTELTRPIAALVNRRSAGIKDLRFGYIVDDDRTNCNPDACLRSHRHNVPLLPTANAVSPCPMAHPTRDRARSSKTLGAYERSDPLMDKSSKCQPSGLVSSGRLLELGEGR